MDDEEGVGRICVPSGGIQLEWEIQDYFSYPQKADVFIASPVFHFSNTSWRFLIYPNGRRSMRSFNWASLYLKIIDPGIKVVDIQFTTGIKLSDNKLHLKHSCWNSFSVSDAIYEIDHFERRSNLLRKQHIIVPEGTLTIFFRASNIEATATSDTSTQTEAAIGTTLSGDLLRLLHNESKHDVVFKVQNQTFRAHRVILGARSPVFAAMFEHNMKENSSGEVNIEDCDPETFQEFLPFVYAGNVGKLSSENAIQMLKLSDKYELSDLMKMCLDYIKQNLCLDMVCDALSIADKYNESDLKALAKQFIIDNIKSILLSDQWISLLQENKPLATELLKSAIPDFKNSILNF